MNWSPITGVPSRFPTIVGQQRVVQVLPAFLLGIGAEEGLDQPAAHISPTTTRYLNVISVECPVLIRCPKSAGPMMPPRTVPTA